MINEMVASKAMVALEGMEWQHGSPQLMMKGMAAWVQIYNELNGSIDEWNGNMGANL